MHQTLNKKYSIDLTFEPIKLPPFDDILVLGKNSVHGKFGVLKAFDILSPNVFEVIDVIEDNVEAVFISKHVLLKIEKENIINLLKVKVFPYVSEGDLIKVDCKINISYKNIEQSF